MRSSFFAARVCFWRDTFGFAKRVCFWRARVCFCSKGIFPSGLVYFIIFHQIFHRFRNSVLILPLPSSFIILPFCSFSPGTIFLSARFPLISASPFCSFSPGTKFLLVLTWHPFSARSHLAQISCFSLWLSAARQCRARPQCPRQAMSSAMRSGGLWPAALPLRLL